ncbi:MAG: DUF697 domain-containing protein, partial [Pseudomonadota bacterium]
GEPSSVPATDNGSGEQNADGGDRWELLQQWRSLWRIVKWGCVGVLSVLALSIAGQVFLFYQMFAAVHPWVGYSFLFGSIALTARFVVWPMIAFLSGPKALNPPDVDLSSPGVSAAQVKKRARFDALYLEQLAVNPALSELGDRVSAAQSEVEAVLSNISSVPPTQSAATLRDVERSAIGPLLKKLDDQVDAYVRKEAVAVGVATSISLNGTIDAFLVLWRNANMVARIARIYGGRPDLRVSAMILRDVAFAVILSRVLEDVSEMAGEALGGVVGKLGGVVVGPFLDGSLNALMTLKLGDLAKRRCKSFDPWSEQTAMGATKAAFDRVTKEANGLVADIFRASGAGVGKVAGAAISGAEAAAAVVKAAPRTAWGIVQGVFGQGVFDKGVFDKAGLGETPFADDPVKPNTI